MVILKIQCDLGSSLEKIYGDNRTEKKVESTTCEGVRLNGRQWSCDTSSRQHRMVLIEQFVPTDSGAQLTTAIKQEEVSCTECARSKALYESYRRAVQS